MVLGMNGRSSGEPRRNNTDTRRSGGGQIKKSQPVTQTSTSTTVTTSHSESQVQKLKPPSAEQLSLAAILGDNTPNNVDDLVSQILGVVRRPEEDVTIALHDNDYDVEKTIEALLDNTENSRDEWTTMSGKKGRGKKQQESEQHGSEQLHRRGRGGGKEGRPFDTRTATTTTSKQTRDSSQSSSDQTLSSENRKERRPPFSGALPPRGRQDLEERGTGKWNDSKDRERSDERNEDKRGTSTWDKRGRNFEDKSKSDQFNEGGFNKRDFSSGRKDFYGGDKRGRRSDDDRGGRTRNRRDEDISGGFAGNDDRGKRRDDDRGRGGDDRGRRDDDRGRRDDDRGRRDDDRGRRDDDRGRRDDDRGRRDDDRGRRDDDRGRGGWNKRDQDDRREGTRWGGDYKRREEGDTRRNNESTWESGKGGNRFEKRRFDGRRDNRPFPPRKSKPYKSQDTWEEKQVNIETTSWGHTEETLINENPPSSPPTSWSHDEWVIVDTPTTDEVTFPEALETTPTIITATPHHDSDISYSNYTDDKRSLMNPAMMEGEEDEESTQEVKKSITGRRYRSSRIPVQPVEMPSYTVESLKLELGSLGINFVGSETAPTTSSDSTSQIMMTASGVIVTDQMFSPTASTQGTSSLLHAASSNFSEDAAVIAISSSLSSSLTPPTKLDPPPGLTHPQHSGNVSVATSGLLSPPEQHQLPPPVTGPTGPFNTSSGPSGNSTYSSLPLGPAPTVQPPSMETTPSYSSVSSVGQNQPLFTSQPSTITMVTNPASSHHSGVSQQPPPSVSMSHSLNSRHNKQHHPTGSSSTGNNTTSKVAHGSVLPMATPTGHTGMVYPPMLHQFPHYGTAPMMIPPTYTPYDVSRYSQGFYSQHQSDSAVFGGGGAGGGATSGGTATQGSSGGGISREHSSNAFSNDMKYDMTTPVVTQQQQQQQGALQSHYYNPYTLYTMYPHLGMAAAGYSAQMNHKGGGGSSYPTTSYHQQTPVQGQYAPLTFDDDTYNKLYSGGPGTISKSNSASSTSGVTGSGASDYGSYSKAYDTSKGGPSYSSYVPSAAMGAPPMGGYMMPPHMMTTPLDNNSRTKHSKYGWAPHT